MLCRLHTAPARVWPVKCKGHTSLSTNARHSRGPRRTSHGRRVPDNGAPSRAPGPKPGKHRGVDHEHSAPLRPAHCPESPARPGQKQQQLRTDSAEGDGGAFASIRSTTTGGERLDDLAPFQTAASLSRAPKRKGERSRKKENKEFNINVLLVEENTLVWETHFGKKKNDLNSNPCYQVFR